MPSWRAIIITAITTLSFMFLMVLIFNAESAFGGADSYQHFLISKYSFTHPELFLHHWGKPLFTALSSPFAQLGFSGMKVFQVLVMLATGLCATRILNRLNFALAPLVIPLVLFTPVFFQCAFSGLTEPLFALVLVGAFALFVSDRFRTAALVISFLPLVRTEGIMMLPLMALALILLKQYKSLPWLAFGIVFYSLLGLIFHHHDLFWLWNESPYSDTGNTYGNGEFLHYITTAETWLGWPLIVAALLGLVFVLFRVFKRPIRVEITHWLLIVGALMGFILAHSYLWGKGSSGSLGLLRIMASVTPLAAILAVVGLEGILFKLRKYNVLLFAGAASMCIGTIAFTLKEDLIPKTLNFEEQGLNYASDWIDYHGHQETKVFFYNPAICFFTHRDLFDYEQCGWASAATEEFPAGSIVVWDAHFGANEGGTQASQLLFHPNLEFRYRYQPEDKPLVLNDIPYELLIFEAFEEPQSKIGSRTLFDEGFESDPDSLSKLQAKQIATGNAASGNRSYRVNPQAPFLEAINMELDPMTNDRYSYMHASAQIFVNDATDLDHTFLIISTEINGQLVDYVSIPASGENPTEAWFELISDHIISPIREPGTRVKCYIWNDGPNEIYVDDFAVKFVTRDPL